MLGRAYRGLLHAGAVAAALLLGVLALLVTADVLARNLGLGHAAVDHRGLGVQPAARHLPGRAVAAPPERARAARRPAHRRCRRPAARALDRLSDLVGLAVCAVFVVYGARAIAELGPAGLAW